MMKLLKLVASRVRIGAALPWNVRNESGMLLLARGFVVEDEDQMRILLERGAYVDAEEARAVLLASEKNPAPRRALGLFDEWEAITRRLESPLKNIHRDPEFLQQIDTLARDIVALIERDADVGIYTIVRQENVQFFNYGFTHSVHTAVACVLMARRMGWPGSQALLLTKAALTMNVAIVEVQGRIATQDVPLLEKQKIAIREHTVKGLEMLRQAGVADPDWLTAVAQHHEHPDGSGYPDGLTEISPMGLVLRHADTFTAKISPRATRPGISTREAARELFQEDKGGAFSTALIREFGIYPPGDFVQLKSGELAVVMRRSASAKSPVAASVTDKNGTPVAHTVRRDTAESEFAIVAPVTDKKQVAFMARVPPQRLYGLGA